jgi:hypothetical protein
LRPHAARRADEIEWCFMHRYFNSPAPADCGRAE